MKDHTKEILQKSGLTDTEAQVYILLLTEGPKNKKYIFKILKLNKTRLPETLIKMKTQNLIEESKKQPDLFSATPLKRALALLLENKKEQHRSLLTNKNQILSTWKSLTRKEEQNQKNK